MYTEGTEIQDSDRVRIYLEKRFIGSGIAGLKVDGWEWRIWYERGKRGSVVGSDWLDDWKQQAQVVKQAGELAD